MLNRKIVIALGLTSCTALAGAFVFPQVFATKYNESTINQQQVVSEKKSKKNEDKTQEQVVAVEHIATPTAVKALYMSSWVGSTSTKRGELIRLIKDSELNAVVLDIKDATGKVSFLVDDPVVADTGSPENRIRDIDVLIKE